MFIWVPLNKNPHFNTLVRSLSEAISENIHKYIDLVKSKIPKYQGSD